ncbi:hypothetical protein BO70DRAFT_359460 [Aspergillus heteromorphus CBS 117.55]|uniref:Uncharacterized protein n=1 Tax=Aspergillus heteromorphus CBS 117.55 TaxID=1448321 RepID=A0A317WRW2_9EURO|nr:uncharacterized protein BO70DRAFT_359460 [Aspergillus heteromorphus CBS 117.55]PWY89139.1 hypothetical protein BO70DRAFT_359460 [Aspergillus heteromorphus CBS 117.55]
MLATRLKSSRTYTPTTQTRDLDDLERGYWFLRVNLSSARPSQTQNENVDQNRHPGSKSKLNTSNTVGAGTVNGNGNGHGHDNANTWPLPLLTRFWTFLSEIITEGRAGWGVWCILEEDISSPVTVNAATITTTPTNTITTTTPTNTNTNTTTITTITSTDVDVDVDADADADADANTNPDPTALTIKIYAWGEIASHIYCLLFLASERRVRKMRAQWRDGADEVVIQM